MKEIMNEKLGDMRLTIRGAKYTQNRQYRKVVALLKASGLDRDTEFDWVGTNITKSEAQRILREATAELPSIMAIDFAWVDDLY